MDKSRKSEPIRIGKILPGVMANIEKRMFENGLKNVPEDEMGVAKESVDGQPMTAERGTQNDGSVHKTI